MQSKLYFRLKSKTVRDLYWLLFSEAPLSDDYTLSPYTMIPMEIINEWQNNSKEYFLELDKDAHDIEHFVKRKKNKRLGFYAEALLSYFFQTFREVELLLQNFQINVEKRTLGEIDFIILYNKRVIHLECSLKYYMLRDLNEFKDDSEWVGPRLRDNLKLKLDKIVQNQLPMGLRKEVQEKIDRPVDISYLFIRGVFFAENAISQGVINRDIPNLFIRISDLKKTNIAPIKILSLPNWMSSLAPIQSNEKLDHIKIDEPLNNPILFMFNDNKARFVVPDEWGTNKM